MEKKTESKKDIIEIKNLPENSPVCGCSATGDNHTHLGATFIKRTVCGKPMGDTVSGRDITVNCPECIAETKYRSEHPEVAKEQLGTVTHKKEK